MARRVAAEVAAIRAAGRLPLVLGGDCTITLGALDGFGEGGLVYFDGDADLTTPERSGSAVADTMGMTHMLGGGSPRLARLGSRYPLLRPGQVVLFGFDPAELDTGEWTELTSRHLYAAPAPAVRADPAGQARRALAYLDRRCDSYLVHFDVDVLHTGLFPLANFPHFAGLTLDQVACLPERVRRRGEVRRAGHHRGQSGPRSLGSAAGGAGGDGGGGAGGRLRAGFSVRACSTRARAAGFAVGPQRADAVDVRASVRVDRGQPVGMTVRPAGVWRLG